MQTLKAIFGFGLSAALVAVSCIHPESDTMRFAFILTLFGTLAALAYPMLLERLERIDRERLERDGEQN